MLNRLVPSLRASVLQSHAAAQFDALTRAFVARFFESEITTGMDDLKGAFFWLLSALAVPGLFLPWLRSFGWEIIVTLGGVEALREVSRSDKIFYLGFTMIASGLLTAIAWSTLLPDRRDAVILGTLPVRPRVIVGAKLAALLVYLLTVAVFMHTIASVFFGSFLSIDRPFSFLLRGVAAHFIASCAAGFAVCLAVTSAQGLALSVFGPRAFRRVSTMLQVALVAIIALGLAYLPAITASIVPTLRGTGAGVQPWVLMTPLAWFLGLYEWILGTEEPAMRHLARLAGVTLLLTTVATVLTFPLAYRRLMLSVSETGGDTLGTVGRRLRAFVAAAAGRHPAARAAGDFFTASLARVEQQRFILAISVGVALAWGLPGWTSYEPSALPGAAMLGLPVAAMMFLLAGIRIAASIPADVRAGWLFEVLDVPRAQARQALERTMMLLGVLPPLLLSAPVYWLLWGAHISSVHAIVMFALGLATIQLLIWHLQGMPCGQRWSPARFDFGRRWPLHLFVFVFVTSVIPQVERMLFEREAGVIVFAVALMLVAFGVRYASARHELAPPFEEVDPVAGVLRLQ